MEDYLNAKWYGNMWLFEVWMLIELFKNENEKWMRTVWGFTLYHEMDKKFIETDLVMNGQWVCGNLNKEQVWIGTIN